MKATVLSDNIGNENLAGEWGLSIFIEYEDKKILLDVGSSGIFLQNANKLSIPIKDTQYAVLSHAHYDHADGMKAFFEAVPEAKFYLRDTCKENSYARYWIISHYIGIPKGVLSKYADRIVYASGDFELCQGVYLIPHKTGGLSVIGKKNHMYIKSENGFIPDDFSHEQSLVFDTEQGLVIFNSCSHGGADTIIHEVQQTFPDKKIHAIIGGFHIYNQSKDEVIHLAEKINETGINKVYTGHCTGKRSFQTLKQVLGDKIEQFHVGLVMEF